ncbi:MAG: protein adenylyltransferase SelO family protein, partial [Pseudomonadota bacterium]|nr:protein adenylyltransferase SelO family protein [Pseudomonadota bacterium]
METNYTGIKTLETSTDSGPKHLGNLRLDNTYSRLPEIFFQEIAPKPVSDPKLIKLNRSLAKELGMDPSTVEARDLDILAGNAAPQESKQIAMVYAGHQFGNWVPRLGDGRAVLIGEVIDESGARRDIQLKGSGPTLFSRMGDGRASVGPVIREYLVSEGMAALQIPTTRSLAMVTTGELIARERMEPGAILTRVASSHIRVGTFQYFYGQKDDAAIRLLADYAINRHYPNAGENSNPYVELLRSVVERTAELISSWMLVGFIHGVMNTDNS